MITAQMVELVSDELIRLIPALSSGWTDRRVGSDAKALVSRNGSASLSIVEDISD